MSLKFIVRMGESLKLNLSKNKVANIDIVNLLK